jgi:hypothetical protein
LKLTQIMVRCKNTNAQKKQKAQLEPKNYHATKEKRSI